MSPPSLQTKPVDSKPTRLTYASPSTSKLPRIPSKPSTSIARDSWPRCPAAPLPSHPTDKHRRILQALGRADAVARAAHRWDLRGSRRANTPAERLAAASHRHRCVLTTTPLPGLRVSPPSHSQDPDADPGAQPHARLSPPPRCVCLAPSATAELAYPIYILQGPAHAMAIQVPKLAQMATDHVYLSFWLYLMCLLLPLAGLTAVFVQRPVLAAAKYMLPSTFEPTRSEHASTLESGRTCSALPSATLPSTVESISKR